MFRSVLRTIVLPRAAPSARLPVRALHASPMLRDEEVRFISTASTHVDLLRKASTNITASMRSRHVVSTRQSRCTVLF
jgi:hypothetical protein